MQAFVRGRVQGVAFRHHTMKKARELGIRGWVRNLPDGRVEVRAEGDVGELDEFVGWLATGPRGRASTESQPFRARPCPVARTS